MVPSIMLGAITQRTGAYGFNGPDKSGEGTNRLMLRVPTPRERHVATMEFQVPVPINAMAWFELANSIMTVTWGLPPPMFLYARISVTPGALIIDGTAVWVTQWLYSSSFPGSEGVSN